MLASRYWRAIYSDERKSFVVKDAGWVDGEPVLEYRFSYLEDMEPGQHLGGLEKIWLEEEGWFNSEFFTFGTYPDEAAFEAAVQQLLTEAQERSASENLDRFLALIDAVKECAIQAELEDDDLFLWEGLFEEGPEDAYSLREAGFDEHRLHDHVERSKDECWRLHVRQVIDPEQQPLGWAVVVLRYPQLTSSATEEEVEQATDAELLDLEHWPAEATAELTRDLIERFMLYGGRVEEPDFAFNDDSELFEYMSIQMSREEILMPEWESLQGDVLRAFIHDEKALVRQRSRWHPHHADQVAEFAQESGLPTHMADQLQAHLIDSLQLTEEFDENSPWRFLDEAE